MGKVSGEHMLATGEKLSIREIHGLALLSPIGWKDAVTVAMLWTDTFSEYYYGPRPAGSLIDQPIGRTLSEGLYFFSLLQSCLDALSSPDSCCIEAKSTERETVAALAGRILSPANFGTVFSSSYWKELARDYCVTSPEDLRCLYLWNVAVRTSHRKQGIGTLLIEEMQRMGIEEGKRRRQGKDPPIQCVCLFVYRSNKPAIRLYDKLGFVRTNWEDTRPSAKKRIDKKYLMVKILKD